MYVNYLPNKGVTLDGTEVGAFLIDSQKNDTIQELSAPWTPYVSPTSNIITITDNIITFDFSDAYAWIGVSMPLVTEIGKHYTVQGTILSGEIDGVINNVKFGISTFVAANNPTKTFHAASVVNQLNTVYTVSFFATQSLYYIHWSGVINKAVTVTPIFTVKSKVYVQETEFIGSAEGTELNTANNATSDNATEVNSTNGFSQVGLDQGFNVFKTVSNLPYPELNTNQNAVSPDGITEANTTTGFTSVGLDGTGANVFASVTKDTPELFTYANAASDPNGNEANAITGFEAQNNAIITSISSPVNSGTYAISVESNTTPTIGAKAIIKIWDIPTSLINDKEYVLSFALRHIGVGGDWSLTLEGDSSLVIIAALKNTDTIYQNYSFKWKQGNHRIQITESNASNDGGVYIDNLSITEVQVNHGNYAIHAECNDTPTSAASFSYSLDNLPTPLKTGFRYIVSFDTKHVGVGGEWRARIIGSTTVNIIISLQNTDNVYSSYMGSFVYDGSTTNYFQMLEVNLNNDGGIYLDNLSIRESNEYHNYSNAASDSSRESNSTDGFTSSNNAIIASVSSPVNVGLYALRVENNTTPNAGGFAALSLVNSLTPLIIGQQYKIEFSARHIGVGGIYRIQISGSTTGIVIVDLSNTDTLYNIYSAVFIHDGVDTNNFIVLENSVTNDGGVYIDNLSITEVQVNAGNYALHAESNDSPISLARCYIDMEANFGLTMGKAYTLSVDAKHIGVGGNWKLSIHENNDNSGGGFDIESNLIDVEYDTYSATWVYNGEKYFVAAEGSGNNDGGVYLDNIRVNESGELHRYSNAAADPAGLEDNSISGWDAISLAQVTSVSSPVNVGNYAISIETNTNPIASFKAYLDLEDETFNLQLGEQYTLSFDARHNGTGGAYKIRMADTINTETQLIVDLTNTDITYKPYSITWTHSAIYKWFIVVENNAGNDGGVYIDNLSIRRSEKDLSATGLGLQIFGVIKKQVVNYNADLFSYSGFTDTSNYFKQPNNLLLNYQSDWFYEFWLKVVNNGTAQVVAIWAGYDGGFQGGAAIQFSVQLTGLFRINMTRNNFTSEGDITESVKAVDDNIWHKINCQRVADNIEIYIDSTIDTTRALVNPATPNNDIAELWIGSNVAVNLSLLNGEIALFKTGSLSKTQTQITNDYNSEKRLFTKDAAFSIVSTAIDFDITVRDLTRNTEFSRNQNVSLGGSVETLFNRQDNFWNTTTTVIEFNDLKYHRLFLDSVVDGQTFTFDPYGITASPSDPKQVTLVSNKYTEGRQNQLALFRIDFKVRDNAS